MATQALLTVSGELAANGPSSALRRSSHMLAVLCLQAQYRGYFVPPRPEKNAVEGQRMNDAFIEERRASLQKYMQKLAAHPIIGRSEVRQMHVDQALHITRGALMLVDAQYMHTPSTAVLLQVMTVSHCNAVADGWV